MINHENCSGTMKNQPKTMKNQPGTIINHVFFMVFMVLMVWFFIFSGRYRIRPDLSIVRHGEDEVRVPWTVLHIPAMENWQIAMLYFFVIW